MNLQGIVEFLKDKKKELEKEFEAEDLPFDDDTILNVELSLGEISQIIEILSAYADASEDEDWEEIEEDEDDDFDLDDEDDEEEY